MFYENLTIPNPTEPIYSTDITDLNITFTAGLVNRINIGIPFWFDAKYGNHFGCRIGYDSQPSPITTGQMSFYAVSAYDETIGYSDSRLIVDCTSNVITINSWGSLPNAQKVTFKFGNYYYVAKLSFYGYQQNNEVLLFNVSEVNTNIPANNEFETNSGTAYFRKNWA